MIFPRTNKASDINVAMIRIAQENNEDIDTMSSEVIRLNSQQQELQDRHNSQVRRWRNYKIAFEAIQLQFDALLGNIDEDELATLLPGYIGK